MLTKSLFNSIVCWSMRSWHGCQQACHTGLQHWDAYLVGIVDYECPTKACMYVHVCVIGAGPRGTIQFWAPVIKAIAGRRWGQGAGLAAWSLFLTSLQSGHDGWRCYVCPAQKGLLKARPFALAPYMEAQAEVARAKTNRPNQKKTSKHTKHTDQTKRKRAKQNKTHKTHRPNQNKPTKTKQRNATRHEKQNTQANPHSTKQTKKTKESKTNQTKHNKPKQKQNKTDIAKQNKTNQAKQAKDKTKQTKQNKQHTKNKNKTNIDAKSGPGWNRATTESFLQSCGCSGKLRLIQVATGPVAWWGVRGLSTCLPGTGREWQRRAIRRAPPTLRTRRAPHPSRS